MSVRYTIVIPTRNRPRQLEQTLSFLASSRCAAPVRVADSGDEAMARLAEQACRRADLNVYYQHFPGDFAVMEKMSAVLHGIDTDYTVFCADDDVLVLSAVEECIEFLELHPDYVACHGRYLGFASKGEGLEIQRIEYDGPAFDGKTAISRMAQLLTRYEALFYAVVRTSVQRVVVDFAKQMTRPMFRELAHGVGLVAQGKVERLGSVYCNRNLKTAGINKRYDWCPPIWLGVDPEEMFLEYVVYRDRVVTLLADRMPGDVTKKALRILVDKVHYLYLHGDSDIETLVARRMPEFRQMAEDADRVRDQMRESLRRPQSIRSRAQHQEGQSGDAPSRYGTLEVRPAGCFRSREELVFIEGVLARWQDAHRGEVSVSATNGCCGET